MILDGFISLITGAAGTNAVSSLIGSRAYKSVLPRGYALPAVAVHRYNGDQEYQFSGPVDIREDWIQFDVYDASDSQPVLEAMRALLVPYVGTLPDGTVVQGCFLERDMDMPFLAEADKKGSAYRSTLGFRVVSVRV